MFGRNIVNYCFVFGALCVFGFTLGLITGWSRTSIASALITGFVGLLSGSVLSLLAGKKNSEEKREAVSLSWDNAIPISVGSLMLCASVVAGAVVGINARNGRIPLLIEPEPALASVASKYPDIEPKLLTRLIMLQHGLANMGCDPQEINLLTERYATAFDADAFNGNDRYLLKQLLTSVRLYAKQVEDKKTDEEFDLQELQILLKSITNLIEPPKADSEITTSSVAQLLVKFEHRDRLTFGNEPEDIDKILALLSNALKATGERGNSALLPAPVAP